MVNRPSWLRRHRRPNRSDRYGELHQVLLAIRIIDAKVDFLMVDIDALQAATDALVTRVGEAVTALNDLSSKIGGGGAVEQAEIDAITAKLTTATDTLGTAVATDDPPTPAPPVDAPAPIDPAPVDTPEPVVIPPTDVTVPDAG